jgi:hypothetical protein
VKAAVTGKEAGAVAAVPGDPSDPGAGASPSGLDQTVPELPPLICNTDAAKSAADVADSPASPNTARSSVSTPSHRVAVVVGALDGRGSSSGAGSMRPIGGDCRTAGSRHNIRVDVPKSPSTPGRYTGLQPLKEAASSHGQGQGKCSNVASSTEPSPRHGIDCTEAGRSPGQPPVHSPRTAVWVLSHSKSSSNSSNSGTVLGKGSSQGWASPTAMDKAAGLGCRNGSSSSSRKGAVRQLSLDKQAVMEAVHVMEDTLRVLQDAMSSVP